MSEAVRDFIFFSKASVKGFEGHFKVEEEANGKLTKILVGIKGQQLLTVNDNESDEYDTSKAFSNVFVKDCEFSTIKLKGYK